MGQNATVASSSNVQRRILALVAAVSAVGMLGCASDGDAGGQSARLSEELGATVVQYISSWNTHDSNVLAGHFTANADMIMGNGPILEGRKAIDDWWRDYFAVQEPERGLTIEVVSTKSMTADVALLNVRTTTGGRTDEGVDLLPRKARGTWVLVRQDGEWHISAMRGMPTQQDRIIRGGG